MNFDQAFDRLISHEGGYVNNPADPGGETRYGISKRSYPGEDIATLTLARAKYLYQRDFWDVLGEEVHPAIKFQAFDFAVNSGAQTAIRKLQSAIGVADDGNWGAVSATRLKGLDVSDVLMLYIAKRLRFMASLSTWKTFGKGWAMRIADNLIYSAKDNP